MNTFLDTVVIPADDRLCYRPESDPWCKEGAVVDEAVYEGLTPDEQWLAGRGGCPEAAEGVAGLDQ
jgi:hypothetical protein